MKTGYICINKTRLYYEVAGAGEALVFIHGFTYDSRAWQKQFAEFKRNYQVIRYDLRGHGQSSMPDPNVEYSHVSDLSSLMDYLSIEKGHIVGNSLGGSIALDFVLCYPDRVRSLILAEAGLNARGISMPQDISSWFMQTVKIARTRGVNDAKRHWLSSPLLASALNNRASRDVAQQMIQDYSGWHWLYEDPVIRELYNVEMLKAIEVPVLIIKGGLSHHWLHDLMEIQRRYIANSHVEQIMGSGHSLSIERPEEFNGLVSDFLSQVLEQ